jgi:hypothetical protein
MEEVGPDEPDARGGGGETVEVNTLEVRESWPGSPPPIWARLTEKEREDIVVYLEEVGDVEEHLEYLRRMDFDETPSGGVQ